MCLQDTVIIIQLLQSVMLITDSDYAVRCLQASCERKVLGILTYSYHILLSVFRKDNVH